MPALITGLGLSTVLVVGAGWFWIALGHDIRVQVTLPQLATLIFFVFIMCAMMTSIGLSKVWANEDGVTTRNMLRARTFKPEDIVGVRLRQGDPWAFLLVRNPAGDEPKRHAILAIQSLEGARAQRKAEQLREWLRAELASAGDPGAQQSEDAEGGDEGASGTEGDRR